MGDTTETAQAETIQTFIYIYIIPTESLSEYRIFSLDSAIYWLLSWLKKYLLSSLPILLVPLDGKWWYPNFSLQNY